MVQYEPLIKKLIKRYNYVDGYDELFQVGRIALWEAYERFDSRKGAFPAYAKTYVTGRFLQFLRKPGFETVEATEKIMDDHLHYDVTYLDSIIVDELLQNLSKRERLCVEYVILQSGSQKELARREQVSYETVRSWKKCALKKLRIKGIAMNKIKEN
ncbi:sigma-70 family RNA polymerase sigma factor [Pseudalkalibacillus berkeleyi]|uniref:Sigma-70 family RNA polymerase sigma factor n=1 Tax=Pseudalkalibacillus berkeleyi TaxID=1069813 RepID=A0ABS9GYN4_9BACL|nr:sigma-70 family RNA polymerase sigma factor [Pseudalkalibacillus berkeleyi]MCF6136800.1 sigma-70 family RNA polymerase sigma factor [Pseudalkalibacillus berkeleyi]